jgi:hypothetical protein
MIDEGVGERAMLDGFGRVNEQARRLDDYEQVAVFVKDFERNRLRVHRRRRAFTDGKLYTIASRYAPARLSRLLIDKTSARADETSDSHATEAAESRREKFVNALAGLFFADVKLK